MPEATLQYRALLSPQERSQHDRFHFEKDRHRYLVTRALIRDVLSHYEPVAPEAWRFKADNYGKPHVIIPIGAARRITFNISHTDGLVVLGIRSGKALGVDTENTPRKALLEVAEQSFSFNERRRLRTLPPRNQVKRFWELWILKESYIKARGMGLSLPLDQFSFDLDVPGAVSIGFAPGFEDQPSRWQFWQLAPNDRYLVSVCAEAPGVDDPPIQLALRGIEPLSPYG